VPCLQVRVADPTFLGYFIDKGVSSAAKVVRKVRSVQSHAPLVHASNWFATAVVAAHLADSQLNARPGLPARECRGVCSTRPRWTSLRG
jgi:hypothetical protein